MSVSERKIEPGTDLTGHFKSQMKKKLSHFDHNSDCRNRNI